MPQQPTTLTIEQMATLINRMRFVVRCKPDSIEDERPYVYQPGNADQPARRSVIPVNHTMRTRHEERYIDHNLNLLSSLRLLPLDSEVYCYAHDEFDIEADKVSSDQFINRSYIEPVYYEVPKVNHHRCNN